MDGGWIAERETGGGPLLYLGCHLVDLMLWLFGEEPATVSATVTRRAGTGVDDTSAIDLEFSGGRVAQLLVSQSAADFYYELQVIGRAGSIILRGHDFVDFEVVVHSTGLEPYREPTIIRQSTDDDHITTIFVPELTEFADAIEQGRPPGITASDGRRVLRVLDAVHESARTHRSVAVGSPMLAVY